MQLNALTEGPGGLSTGALLDWLVCACMTHAYSAGSVKHDRLHRFYPPSISSKSTPLDPGFQEAPFSVQSMELLLSHCEITALYYH